MVTPSPASIVVIPFPFSDLSNTKLRPALVIASAQKDDWVLCQITSKSYSDPHAIQLDHNSFKQGTLRLMSYVRPMKLFTASESLITKRIAIVNDDKFEEIVTSLIQKLQENIPDSPSHKVVQASQPWVKCLWDRAIHSLFKIVNRH